MIRERPVYVSHDTENYEDRTSQITYHIVFMEVYSLSQSSAALPTSNEPSLSILGEKARVFSFIFMDYNWVLSSRGNQSRKVASTFTVYWMFSTTNFASHLCMSSAANIQEGPYTCKVYFVLLFLKASEIALNLWDQDMALPHLIGSSGSPEWM